MRFVLAVATLPAHKQAANLATSTAPIVAERKESSAFCLP